MSSDIVAKQHLSHLPCPAVECIQRYFWNDQGTHGPDVRRHVLPLVCKQWKRCLELAPDAWTEVTITDEDLWPVSKPSANFQEMKNWFTTHGKSIRKLSIDLMRWNYHLCSPETLELLLVDVLSAVHGTLTHLVLRIHDAPLATAHAWLHLASEVSGSNTELHKSQPKIWPNLSVLELEIDGKGAASQALASHAAKQVLSTLPHLKALRKVAIRLNSVKLCVLPLALSTCDQIEDFSLNFSVIGGAVGLLLPAKRPSSLPLPGKLRRLCLIHVPFATEDVIDTVLVGCRDLEAFTITSIM